MPALVLLGEFTFVRLAEVSVEDMRHLRPIQRIRAYYATLHAEAPRFFPAADNADDVDLFREMGISGRQRSQAWFTAATTLAAINRIVAATGLAMLIRWLGVALTAATVIGFVTAVVFVAAHVGWERRRYEVGLAEA